MAVSPSEEDLILRPNPTRIKCKLRHSGQTLLLDVVQRCRRSLLWLASHICLCITQGRNIRVCVRVRCVYACVWFSITILTLPVSCFPHSVALYNNGWSATTTNGYDQLIHYLITLTNCRLISNKAPNSCTLYYLYSLFNIVPLLSAL